MVTSDAHISYTLKDESKYEGVIWNKVYSNLAINTQRTEADEHCVFGCAKVTNYKKSTRTCQLPKFQLKQRKTG